MTKMTEGTAARRFSIAGGAKYRKGGKVELPAGQFADLERVGLVKARPAKDAAAAD